MRGLFWLLALFALAVAVALGARFNEGYVLLVYPPYRVEVSLNFFVLATAVLFLIGYTLLRTLALAFALPKQARLFRAQRQREKAALIFQDAVRLLFEGRFGQALKKASAASAAGIAPGLSALIAARAAQRMREPLKQQGWLTRAKLDDPRTEAATLMLEAEMMNEARRFDEALSALNKLQEKQGRHIAALRLELRARQGTGDWLGVLRIARQLAKRDAMLPEVLREISTQAHLANIKQLRDDLKALRSYLRDIPALEHGRRLLAAAASALRELGADAEAQGLIEEALNSTSESGWQAELITIYGRLSGGEITSRIARAENWLQQEPRNADLLLALGRMCCQQRLWGKAQSYLEASLAVQETATAHLELARLCEQLERPEVANQHYRASALLETR